MGFELSYSQLAELLTTSLNATAEQMQSDYTFNIYAEIGENKPSTAISGVLLCNGAKTQPISDCDYRLYNFSLNLVIPAPKSNFNLENVEKILNKFIADYNYTRHEFTQNSEAVGGGILFLKAPKTQQFKTEYGQGDVVNLTLDFDLLFTKDLLTNFDLSITLDGERVPLTYVRLSSVKGGKTNVIHTKSLMETLATQQQNYYKLKFPVFMESAIAKKLQKAITKTDSVDNDILNTTFTLKGTYESDNTLTFEKDVILINETAIEMLSTDIGFFDITLTETSSGTHATQYSIALIDWKFDKGSDNTIFFETAQEQETFFINKIENGGADFDEIVAPNLNSLYLTSQIYLNSRKYDIFDLIRKNYAIIKVERANEDAKYFYYFVDKAQIGAENQVYYDLTLDTVQTDYIPNRHNIADCEIQRACLDRWIDNGDGTISFNGKFSSDLFEREDFKEMAKRLATRKRMKFKYPTLNIDKKFYLSDGDTQLYYDDGDDAWNNKQWVGFNDLYGQDIWVLKRDGVTHYYYSNLNYGDYENIDGEWKPITWYNDTGGIKYISGRDIFYYRSRVFYLNNGETWELKDTGRWKEITMRIDDQSSGVDAIEYGSWLKTTGAETITFPTGADGQDIWYYSPTDARDGYGYVLYSNFDKGDNLGSYYYIWQFRLKVANNDELVWEYYNIRTLGDAETSAYLPIKGRDIWTMPVYNGGVQTTSRVYYNYTNPASSNGTWGLYHWGGPYEAPSNGGAENIYLMDGVYYYSYGGTQTYLDVNEWKPVDWSGTAPEYGKDVWNLQGVGADFPYHYDGNGIHLVRTGNDGPGMFTWQTYVWGSGTMSPSEGKHIWKFNGVYYYDDGEVHLKCIQAFGQRPSWGVNQWGGTAPQRGDCIWECNGVYHYDYETTHLKLVYNETEEKWVWVEHLWDGTPPEYGKDVWELDGVYHYDNYDTHKRLSGNVWVNYNWNFAIAGDRLYGRDVWKLGGVYHYDHHSAGPMHRVLYRGIKTFDAEITMPVSSSQHPWWEYLEWKSGGDTIHFNGEDVWTDWTQYADGNVNVDNKYIGFQYKTGDTSQAELIEQNWGGLSGWTYQQKLESGRNVWMQKFFHEEHNQDYVDFLNDEVIGWVYVLVNAKPYQFPKMSNGTFENYTLREAMAGTPDIDEDQQHIPYGYSILCFPIVEGNKQLNIKTPDEDPKRIIISPNGLVGFLEKNNNFSYVYAMKLSIKPPTFLSKRISFDYALRELTDTHRLNDFEIEVDQSVISVLPTKKIGDGNNYYGLFYVKLDVREAYEMFCDVDVNYTFSKNEVVGQNKNIKFNPKLNNADFKSLRLTFAGNSFELDLQKINTNKPTFLYNELITGDISKFILRLKTTGDEYVFNSAYSQSFNGFISTNDLSLPIVNDQYSQYLANNKNAYLSYLANVDYNLRKDLRGELWGFGKIVGTLASGNLGGFISGGADLIQQHTEIPRKYAHEEKMRNFTIDNMMNAPASLVNANGNALFTYTVAKFGIYYEVLEALPIEQEMANDNMVQYGFSYGRIGNITDFDNIRKYFNYIVADLKVIDAPMSNEERSDLKMRFLSGVRFWNLQDGETDIEIDYDRENYERRLEETS